jgi:hypothetical protein
VGEPDLYPSVRRGVGLVGAHESHIGMPTEQEERDLALGLGAAQVRRGFAGGAFDASQPGVK